MTARLPTVGGDSGNWGTVLNEYLETEHGSDGTHSKPLTVQFIYKTTVITSGSTYTISATADHVIIVRKTSGSATALTLPAAPTTGTQYMIKDGKGDAATNNITISAVDSATIDGETNLVMNANYTAVTLIYNGTEWNIL